MCKQGKCQLAYADGRRPTNLLLRQFVVTDIAGMLAVACSLNTVVESYMAGNTSTAQPMMMSHSIDDDNQRCLTSGMDVINTFGYKPVGLRSVVTHLLR